MKILLALLQYGKLTGSELYVYELARELLSLGHTVGIASLSLDKDSELVARLQHPHLEYYQLSEIKNEWDIAHCNQTQVTEMVKMIVKCPIVQTIHSEILNQYESPVNDIAHYIAVRPKIYENLANVYPSEKVSLIYNGVDPKRFKKFKVTNKAIVFPGTVNYLRANAFKDCANYMKDGFKIIYIGDGWPKEGANGNAYFMKPRWDIENVYKMGSMTASIMIGRTTIEGWMMGLPGLVYIIDDKGAILKTKVYDVPAHIDRYRSDYMANEIMEVYKRYV